MKTIGLIGGMSWESSVTYYQIINRYIQQELGGYHSAKCILYSLDFAEIEECQQSGNWGKSAEIITTAAQSLISAGADIIVICTNTMHKVYEDVKKNITAPMLHIADATAHILKEKGIKKVALLGTKYTMTQDFYKDIIIRNNIEVIIPDEEDIEKINDIIFNELCAGKILEKSKQYYLSRINTLASRGAEGIILGCTEIGLLVSQKDTVVPLFDTAVIHAEQIARLSLEKAL